MTLDKALKFLKFRIIEVPELNPKTSGKGRKWTSASGGIHGLNL